jgi:hypothetical protein
MSAPAQATREAVSTLDLAALRLMTFKELEALYRTAKRPSAMSNLDGDGKGAMLAWRHPVSGPFAALLRAMGRSRGFPWMGKSFKSQSSDKGEGINRINLQFYKTRWFPFGTRFESSFLDGKPTLVLDYARPGNPPFIRQIVDEVREVGPGLYLGPAALKIGGKPRPILFFAISYA